jgi:hypothetical protein
MGEMRMEEFEITELDVGSNFVDIDINDGAAEMKFYKVSKATIQKCLKPFGLKLTKKQLEDYEY